jgi:hypothetical protein
MRCEPRRRETAIRYEHASLSPALPRYCGLQLWHNRGYSSAKTNWSHARDWICVGKVAAAATRQSPPAHPCVESASAY